MFQLKIAKDGNAVKYIPLLRKFDPSLSIGELRRRLEAEEIVVQQEMVPHWDPLDDLRGVDRVKLFCELVEALKAKGARVTVLANGSVLTPQMFRNQLQLLREIAFQVELDVDREAEE